MVPGVGVELFAVFQDTQKTRKLLMVRVLTKTFKSVESFESSFLGTPQVHGD